MDAGVLVALVGATGVGAVLKTVVDHLLGRGKLRIDEAGKIRAELRAEIDRKDRYIAALEKRIEERDREFEKRIALLEEELEKTETERNALDMSFAKYKLDVYRELLEAGVDKALVDRVRTMR